MFDFFLALAAAASVVAGGADRAGEGQAAPAAADVAPAFLAPPPELVAEPQVPTGRFTTAAEIKPILAATRANWVSLREFEGQDLLYVTHLWAWRCGLAQIRIGINGASPEIWPLPACHEDQPSPNMILGSDGLPFRNFALGEVEFVDIVVVYDDLTEESARFERASVLMP